MPFFFKKDRELEPLKEDKEESNDAVDIGAGFAAAESARVSTQAADQKFAKPLKYDRTLLDDGAAKRAAKASAFSSGVQVKDPYTGDVLSLTKKEAKLLYGEDWTKHLAEADHKVSLEQRYQQTKDNPWLTNEDIKASSNSQENLDVVSRRYNNAKRNRSNTAFVSDDEYLDKTGVSLSEEGKARAIESDRKAQAALNRRDFLDSAENIVKTAHSAGIDAAKNAGITALTMSGIMNLTAVLKGEKSAEDAIADTVSTTGTVAMTTYVMGGGLTTVSHSLSNVSQSLASVSTSMTGVSKTLTDSSSKFIRALTESNVPGKVITAVMLAGNTLKRYGNGEITTQECLIELGEKGLNFSVTGYSMAVGQAFIPIPIVGAAIGALVGSTITSNYYHQLITTLQQKELEHQERLRIIAECKQAACQTHAFRMELEQYLDNYFQDYRDCFDEALSSIHFAFQAGDADGVIAGTNQITRKLGGKVYYDNMDEFKKYLFDDSTDIL